MQFLRCQQPGVARALEWAGLEGWNPGQNDAATFFQIDPGGFWLGQLGDRPVASLSAVQWNDDFAFIGLYIVVPEERGKGYGWQLWRHVVQAHEGKCLGLDGVVAQQANYARSGFQLAHRSLRWAGHAGQFTGKSPQVVPLHQLDQDELIRLDCAVSPADRPHYVKTWLAQPDTRSWGLASHGSVDGLAVARPCQSGWKIGPLIARTAEQARELMHACCTGLASDTPVFVDAPEPNAAAQDLFAGAGFTVSFECARMYTRPVRQHRLDWLYGVTSFELG
ncbi:MAG: GNAT family N-acetyltransferase [Candidatus Eremiobacteraeota bacterium]|nr:GNAT family N-acetyltransferase [Candidatus Eremiobacteraeota bacterium]MCW5871073.1 GNAT family N-acetyltransferase [Candidatus Eremiobacteraeota bacterium]